MPTIQNGSHVGLPRSNLCSLIFVSFLSPCFINITLIFTCANLLILKWRSCGFVHRVGYLLQGSDDVSISLFFFSWLDNSGGPRPPLRGSSITFRHTTLGMTPLDEWSARHRDLYLTKYNTRKRQTSLPPNRYSNPQSQQASVRRPTP